MNEQKLKLLCISALLLNDRNSIFELMDHYDTKLTTHEESHLRFDFDSLAVILIKLNKDGSVHSVKYDNVDSQDIYFPNDEDIQRYLKKFKKATAHSKITEWGNSKPVPDLSVLWVLSTASFTLVPTQDTYLFKDDSIIVKTFKDISKNQLTILVEEHFSELDYMQKMSIEQLIKSEVQKESRRCNGIVQLAAQKLMDLPYE